MVPPVYFCRLCYASVATKFKGWHQKQVPLIIEIIGTRCKSSILYASSDQDSGIMEGWHQEDVCRLNKGLEKQSGIVNSMEFYFFLYKVETYTLP